MHGSGDWVLEMFRYVDRGLGSLVLVEHPKFPSTCSTITPLKKFQCTHMDQNKYIIPTPFQKVQNQSEIKTNLYQNSSGRLRYKVPSFEHTSFSVPLHKEPNSGLPWWCCG